MLLERPYSKWAVYTEYQGYHIGALNAFADITYDLGYHILVRGTLDLNLVQPEGRDLITLPFYRIGIGYEVMPDNQLLISLTNKGMNLDKHYPDFYLIRLPVLQFQFIRDFRWD